ncbi:MAG: hypothetical protein SGJ20_12980 [Planctomycetota bacterium]|nr:hypothetical protein [Planctomycetota bacterium]
MSKLVSVGGYALRAAAGLLVFSAFSATAFGAQISVPELDPGSIVSGIAMLAAGGMFVADRLLMKARAKA